MSSKKEPHYVRERKIILQYIKNDSPIILDIGVGQCACMSLLMAQKGYQVIAIDNEQDALENAKTRINESGVDGQINLKLEDATSLSFADGSFMNIVAYNSLHHVQNLDKAVAEIYRVLRPEGRAIISDFDETAEGYLDDLCDLLKSRFKQVRQIKRKYRRIFVCRKTKTKKII
ncbi:MAG: methyltransferase domain-containing protein [candidate division KSB1 bacterium]|nr:methyltransferase domain-containing protein [candidate division KSB1 bacterium]